MGQCATSCFALRPSIAVRVLMIGLDNGGKKTLLGRLGPVISFDPAFNFHVDTVDSKELYIRSWDIGGYWQPKALWSHFYKYTEGMLFSLSF